MDTLKLDLDLFRNQIETNRRFEKCLPWKAEYEAEKFREFFSQNTGKVVFLHTVGIHAYQVKDVNDISVTLERVAKTHDPDEDIKVRLFASLRSSYAVGEFAFMT